MTCVVCVCGGENDFLLSGVNAFCQVKSRACLVGYQAHSSDVPADSTGGNQARKRKDKPTGLT